jgi:hypothetical protein
MKKYIFITLLSFQIYAQTKHESTNFYIDEKKVYWQNTYDVPNTKSTDLFTFFEKYIISSFKTTDLRISEDKISFTVTDQRLNVKDYGKKSMTSAIFVQNWQSFLCVVDFKDSKYRVTLKEIQFTNKAIGLGYTNEDITFYVTTSKETEFTNKKVFNEALLMLDEFYNKIYEPSNIMKEEKDW